MSIESVMPSNHLILCRTLLLLLSIFPSLRVFFNESALCIRWPKYWIFNFSVNPSNKHAGLNSFRINWSTFDENIHSYQPPCPSPTPRVYPYSCPLSQWCHRTILSSVIPFSSCPQSYLTSESFPMSRPFTSSAQSTEASASVSVLPMNIEGWFLLGLPGVEYKIRPALVAAVEG